jgi:hypothetical protein
MRITEPCFSKEWRSKDLGDMNRNHVHRGNEAQFMSGRISPILHYSMAAWNQNGFFSASPARKSQSVRKKPQPQGT